jgi:hypothetical protein
MIYILEELLLSRHRNGSAEGTPALHPYPKQKTIGGRRKKSERQDNPKASNRPFEPGSAIGGF